MIGSHNPDTIRQCLSEVRSRFESVSAAIFTTFSFSPDIFEQNILPIVCGTADFADEKERQYRTNQELSRMPVAVFHDPAAVTRGGGDFRYSTFPVSPRNSQNARTYFHPKCVLLSGRLSDSQNDAVVLVCSSANLTRNGYGRNCECFGQSAITSSRNPAYDMIGAFLTYLASRMEEGLSRAQISQARACSAVSVLSEYWQRVGENEEQQDGPRFYFSPSSKDGFLEFLMADRAKGWKRLLVASPYWSNVDKELEALWEIDEWHFVPSRLSGDKVRFGFPKQERDELAETSGVHFWEPVADFCGGPARFWHAKVYALLAAHGASELLRVAVGSANCTSNGLRGREGNVEAMLVESLSGTRIWRKLEKAWDTYISQADEDLFRDPVPEEECEEPEPPPVDMMVVFDWQTEAYRVEFAERQARGLLKCNLHLSGTSTPQELRSRKSPLSVRVNSTALKQIHRTFHVEFRRQGATEDECFIGLISELNDQCCETKVYEPACDIRDIMAFWRGRTKGVGYERQRNDGGMSAEMQEQYNLNLFDFFRASKALRGKLNEAVTEGRHHIVKSLLLRPPTSVYSMAQQIMTAKIPDAEKLAVLWECDDILRHFIDVDGMGVSKANTSVRAAMRELRETVARRLSLREDLIEGVPDAMSRALKAIDLLDWFREHTIAII